MYCIGFLIQIFNGMIFKMGIKLFLVLSIHVFHTLVKFTDNHMHVNVFLLNMNMYRRIIRLQMLDLYRGNNVVTIAGLFNQLI